MLVKYSTPLHINLPLKSIHNQTATTYEEAHKLLLQDKFRSINNPGSVFRLGPLLSLQTIQNYISDSNEVPFPHAVTPKTAFSTPDTIKDVLKTKSNKSAPGIDNIRYSHVKQVNRLHGSVICDLVNACVQFQHMPTVNKLAQLSLILKPGKDPHITSAI